MKYLILLFISSCGMNQLQSSYERKYTVTMHEYCPNHYIMAQDVNGDRFCVLSDNSRFKTFSHETKVNNRAVAKKSKKIAKIDCKRVFREINQCMR